MKTIRCAIYTRKSSEEGLEQAFNSLDAQREACAAYVLSQASEGWTALPDIYDDGGLSGGSLERPALQRLLADIAGGKVDIIVVYKVDRLTRSLLDFSKLVEAFDKASVSFVSITQSFNTTTSMGRLTLNMLLSFAQFEREVTAERIRDKIAASKARGLWMGGIPPLGYAPDGRTLKIIPDHAAIVCDIYARYLALGNVRLVAEQLVWEDRFSPKRTHSNGREFGGGPFFPGQLYAILKSPTYVGDIGHKGKVYPGLHEPIIDRDTWAAVQARLAEQRQGTRRGARAASPSPLAGKVIDAAGNPLIASHACKGSRRYRYYISRPGSDTVLRIPATELEAAVAECIADAVENPVELCARVGFSTAPGALSDLGTKAAESARRLQQRERSLLRPVVHQVRVFDDHIKVECDTSAVAALMGGEASKSDGSTMSLIRKVRLKRSGRAMRLIHAGGAAVGHTPSQSLVRLLVKARRWWALLKAGDIAITTLARRERVGSSYMSRVVRLAFLAPAVVDAILAGKTRADVDGVMLTSRDVLTPSWAEQVKRLLPRQAG